MGLTKNTNETLRAVARMANVDRGAGYPVRQMTPPAWRHQISENASTTEPASLLAISVADTADAGRLTTIDK
jgi:hypothetical protein